MPSTWRSSRARSACCSIILRMQAYFGASVFWLRRLAALGGEEETVAHWQLKRNGERRGILQIVEDKP